MAALVARHAEAKVATALRDTPVVAINGARQVGKSTLVRNVQYSGTVEVVTFDDPATRSAAAYDPRSFVSRDVDTLVIDEAQLEPSIFRSIKAEVDRDRRPGRFVITGSSRLLAAPDMADALVGRVETIELWPFSQVELENTSHSFVDRAFVEPRSMVRSGSVGRDAVLDRVCRGGLPEIVARPADRRGAWFDSYVTTIVERVVREVSELERLAEIPRLLRLCATRTAQELNVADVSNALGIPARTGSSYIARLATAFLVQLVPAWSTNLSAKVVKRPKLSLLDTGLAAHLVGATPGSLRSANNGALGQLVETFVVNELQRQASSAARPPTLWHFRDRSGAEVDLVLEAPDGTIVGVEIKATSSPSSRDLKGLTFLADRLGSRFVFGFVVCLAPEAQPFGNRFAAIPIDRLWG